MSHGANKEELTHFFKKEWASAHYSELIGNHPLCTAHGDKCTWITVTDRHVYSTEVLELYSTQMEADTRIFLHAEDASYTEDAIVIKSSDTDVEILAWFMQEAIMTFMYISIQAITSKLGLSMCRALLGLHAFTGSDVTSAYFMKGKVEPFKILKKNDQAQKAMEELGTSFTVSKNLHKACEKFTCEIYGKPGADLNEMHYILFCSTQQQSQHLPPTRDTLRKHDERSKYRAGIWHRAREAKPVVGPWLERHK
jgi:hypothetical protein